MSLRSHGHTPRLTPILEAVLRATCTRTRTWPSKTPPPRDLPLATLATQIEIDDRATPCYDTNTIPYVLPGKSRAVRVGVRLGPESVTAGCNAYLFPPPVNSISTTAVRMICTIIGCTTAAVRNVSQSPFLSRSAPPHNVISVRPLGRVPDPLLTPPFPPTHIYFLVKPSCLHRTRQERHRSNQRRRNLRRTSARGTLPTTRRRCWRDNRCE